MRIGIGNDHRGYYVKKQLMNLLKDKEVIDYGADTTESVDYPIYAFKVGEAIKNMDIDLGILICGTGIGMSIACNKVKGVRCAKVDNKEEAKITRIDNNSNVIAISASKDIEEIKDIVLNFINQPFTDEERHQRRIDMIDNYGMENEC